MINVFISLPMGGKTEEEILTQRSEIFKNFCKKRVEENEKDFFVLQDNFIKGGGGINPLLALSYSIGILSQSDVVVFAKGWEYHRGCVIEKQCCERYGIPMYFEENF